MSSNHFIYIKNILSSSASRNKLLSPLIIFSHLTFHFYMECFLAQMILARGSLGTSQMIVSIFFSFSHPIIFELEVQFNQRHAILKFQPYWRIYVKLPDKFQLIGFFKWISHYSLFKLFQALSNLYHRIEQSISTGFDCISLIYQEIWKSVLWLFPVLQIAGSTFKKMEKTVCLHLKL